MDDIIGACVDLRRRGTVVVRPLYFMLRFYKSSRVKSNYLRGDLDGGSCGISAGGRTWGARLRKTFL